MDQSFPLIASVRELKQREATLSRQLKTASTEDVRASLLLQRASLRVQLRHGDDALADLDTIRTTRLLHESDAKFLQVQADCHLMRFETSSVGFADRHELEKAILLYDQIIHDGQADNICWVHYQLGRAQIFAMNFLSAVEQFQQALVLPDATHHPELSAYCYERLAYVAYFDQRNSKDALLYLQRALDTYPSAAEPLWRASVHLRCGSILRELHMVEPALEATSAAYEIARSSENKAIIAEALLAIADLLTMLPGHDYEVIEVVNRYMYFEKRPLGADLTWARLYNIIGDAYFNVGQYSNAVDAYHSVQFFSPDYVSEGQVTFRLARCYYQLRQYKRTQQLAQEMLMDSDNEFVDGTQGHVYELLGNAFFAVGDFKQAENAYEQAIVFFAKHQFPNAQAELYLQLSRARQHD
jgi:tetratricopeptide (TPR) repeat protein